jgi:hypothetical protein
MASSSSVTPTKEKETEKKLKRSIEEGPLDPGFYIESNKLRKFLECIQSMLNSEIKSNAMVIERVCVFTPDGLTITHMSVEQQRYHELKLGHGFFNTYTVAAPGRKFLLNLAEMKEVFEKHKKSAAEKCFRMRLTRTNILEIGIGEKNEWFPLYPSCPKPGFEQQRMQCQTSFDLTQKTYPFTLMMKTDKLHKTIKQFEKDSAVHLRYIPQKSLAFIGEESNFKDVLEIQTKLENPFETHEKRVVWIKENSNDSTGPITTGPITSHCKLQKESAMDTKDSKSAKDEFEQTFLPKALWTAVKKSRIAKYTTLMFTHDKPLILYFEIEYPHSYYYVMLNHVSRVRTAHRANLSSDAEHKIATHLARTGSAILSLDEIIRNAKQFIDSSSSPIPPTPTPSKPIPPLQSPKKNK